MQLFTRSLLVFLLSCICNSPAGDITGTVTLKGKPPPERTVDLQAHPDLAAKHSNGLTTRHYEVGANGGLQNVLVYLREDFRGTKFEPVAAPAVLDHVGGLFEPYVLGLQAGQELQLKCTDGTICSFHAMPKVNREFNITPFLNKSASLNFTEAEVPVRFKCDLHPWNYAYVGVFAHPFFAVTDKQGQFGIRGVPAGHYTLATFHPKSGTSSKPLVVTEATTKINFEVQAVENIRAAELRQHAQRYVEISADIELISWRGDDSN